MPQDETSVSEAEVEAAAAAIDPWAFDIDNHTVNSKIYRQGKALDEARAALTAAAYVRALAQTCQIEIDKVVDHHLVTSRSGALGIRKGK